MLLMNFVINVLNVLKVKCFDCVSMINQKCMSRPKIIDANANETVFYPYSIKVNKRSNRSCSNFNNPYAKLCVPDIVKNMNVKIFIIIILWIYCRFFIFIHLADSMCDPTLFKLILLKS